MKVYISGPMTGIENHNFPAFYEAEEQLIKSGYEPLNPARHGSDPSMSWSDYLRRDIQDVLESRGVALLPGWEESKGAKLESHIAQELGMPCYEIQHWLSASVWEEWGYL